MTESVLFRVDGVLLDDFDRLCNTAGLSRSAAIRQLMRRAVDEAAGLVPLFDPPSLRPDPVKQKAP